MKDQLVQNEPHAFGKEMVAKKKKEAGIYKKKKVKIDLIKEVRILDDAKWW